MKSCPRSTWLQSEAKGEWSWGRGAIPAAFAAGWMVASGTPTPISHPYGSNGGRPWPARSRPSALNSKCHRCRQQGEPGLRSGQRLLCARSMAKLKTSCSACLIWILTVPEFPPACLTKIRGTGSIIDALPTPRIEVSAVPRQPCAKPAKWVSRAGGSGAADDTKTNTALQNSALGVGLLTVGSYERSTTVAKHR